MVTITTITQPSCPNCKSLHEGLDNLGLTYHNLDGSQPEGLAVLAYHDAIGVQMPVMMVDGVMVRGWRTWLARRGEGAS